MPMLDVFDSDAFTLRSLTDSINRVKFVPGRLGQMGLYQESSVITTKVEIELKNGILVLIPPTPRGGPGTSVRKQKRSAIAIDVPHFEVNDAVMAEEVQNVRAWGSESGVQLVADRIAERDALIQQSFAATQEYARIGAVKGIITYADGTELDLFGLFGVDQPAEVDMNLDAAADTGAVREACAGVERSIATALGGLPFQYVHAFCSDTFFDALISNIEVRNTYKNTPMAQVLRDGYVTPYGKIFGAFEFGGIVWENYRGAVAKSSDDSEANTTLQKFVTDDKCHFFPVGVPGLFRTVYAPADLEGAVNTPGQRLYQWQYPMQNGKGRHLDTQMNALEYCTRPETLIQGKLT